MSTQNQSKIEKKISASFRESVDAKQATLKTEKQKIIQAADLMFKAISSGNKIMSCGNGGSAADAQHLAAEFIVRLRPHINRNPIPALTLAQDTSTLTACGNDYSFDDIFLRIYFYFSFVPNIILFQIRIKKFLIKIKTTINIHFKSILYCNQLFYYTDKAIRINVSFIRQ